MKGGGKKKEKRKRERRKREESIEVEGGKKKKKKKTMGYKLKRVMEIPAVKYIFVKLLKSICKPTSFNTMIEENKKKRRFGHYYTEHLAREDFCIDRSPREKEKRISISKKTRRPPRTRSTSLYLKRTNSH